MNPFPIKPPEQRSVLDPRDKPYFARITDELHIGYKKGKSISRWVVRRRVGNGYKSRTFSNVVPDDSTPADGSKVLNFDQALARATTMNIECTADTSVRHCSFCSKSQHDVETLIAGPSSYICGDCVGLCNKILDDYKNDSPTSEA